MKSKAPLSAMEQLVMVMVFALAAALCVQVFALSSNISKGYDEKTHAMVLTQNAAELLHASKGDYSALSEKIGGSSDSEGWTVYYDKNWEKLESEDGAAYVLIAEEMPGMHELLGLADISLYDMNGEYIYTLPCSWQEVSEDE